MQNHDFCSSDSDKSPGVFVDLLANPERYTGYSGPSSHNIWKFLYNLSQDISVNQFAHSEKHFIINDFFQSLISGLHASISTHISNEYFFEDSNCWGENPSLYYDRVGNHPDRLEKMYFVYSLIREAVLKISPILMSINYSCDTEENSNDLIEVCFNFFY